MFGFRLRSPNNTDKVKPNTGLAYTVSFYSDNAKNICIDICSKPLEHVHHTCFSLKVLTSLLLPKRSA